jgi:hypothetical protein
MAASESPDEATRPRWIVCAPLPLFAPSTSVFRVALALVFSIAVVAAWWLFGLFAQMLIMLAALAVLMLVGFSLWFFLTFALRFGRPAVPDIPAAAIEPWSKSNAVVHAAIHQLERQRSPIVLRGSGMWTWSDFARVVMEYGEPVPRTVVDEAAAPRLRAIELPRDMLEPESILTSVPFSRGTIRLMLVFYVVMVLLQLIGGHWIGAGMFLVMGLLLAVTIPEIRDATRLFQYEDGKIIAGMGGVTDHQNRRWTINDALLLVQIRRKPGPLFVHLIGEAGHLLLTFTDETDRDFIALWQRWNHPHPRPELLQRA